MRGAGGITGPISEQLAFRVDGVYVTRDGFYDVVNAADGTEDEVNDRNRFFVRGQLLFEPSDALTIRLIGDYTQRERILLRRGLCRHRARPSIRRRASPATSASAHRAPAARRRQPHHRRADQPRRRLPVARAIPSTGSIALTPGRTYEGETTDWGISAQVDWDFGGAHADLDHRLSRL